MECHSLWVQQRLRRREFQLLKVAGESNPADLFTKHLESRAKLDQLTALFHCKFMEGRPATAPAVRQIGAKKKQEADVNQAADESILPHMCAPEEILKRFPAAVAHPAPLDEDDMDPVEELADPVPAIQAQRRVLRSIQASSTTICNIPVSSSSSSSRNGTGRLPRRKRKKAGCAGAYVIEEERCMAKASYEGIGATSDVTDITIGIYEASSVRARRDISTVLCRSDQEQTLSGGSRDGPYTDRGAKGIWPRHHTQACGFVRSFVRQSGERPGGVFMCGPYGSSVNCKSFVFPNQPE